jgi:hypothetical protein
VNHRLSTSNSGVSSSFSFLFLCFFQTLFISNYLPFFFRRLVTYDPFKLILKQWIPETFRISPSQGFYLHKVKKQKVLGRTAYFPWYDTGHTENDASNNSSIVACLFVTTVTFLPSSCLVTIGGFLTSRCLATIGGIHRHTHTQTTTWTHKPTLIFQDKESRLKMVERYCTSLILVYAFRPLGDVILFSWKYHLPVLVRDMVAANEWNVIKIVRTVFKSIGFLSGAPVKGPYQFLGLMFVFTGHWPTMDKLLNTEYKWNLSNC